MQPSATAETALVVRVASLRDLDRLAAVELEAFADDAYDRAELQDVLERQDCTVHVAEADGAVVGFAVTQLIPLREFASRYGLPLEKLPLGRQKREACIGYFKSVAVRPTHWRRGVGRRLYEARVSLLDRLGIDSVFLVQMPRPDLPPFHTAMGFSPLGLDSDRRYRSGGRGAVWHRFVAT
jgi:ribosomal protein S18 acetylase RimI-like enzyme